MKKISCVLLFPIAFFISCGEDSIESAPLKHNQKLDFDHGLFNYHTIISSNDAHSGKKFSRADSISPYAIGYAILIADSLKDKNIFINVKAWVRTGDLNNNNDLVVSLTLNDSILFWQYCGSKEFISVVNEWSELNKTIQIPKEIASINNVCLNVMSHNVSAKSYFDVDDLEIEISTDSK